MELQQLNLSELKLGIPLPWSIYDATGHMLLSRGTVVNSQQQFESLCERGAFADAEEKRKATQPASPESTTVFNPFHLWEKLEAYLAAVLRLPPKKSDFPKQMALLCQLIETLTVKDPDAGLAVMHMQDHQRYAISHAIHCALVSNLIARRLDVPAEERKSLVSAALTMNVGMVELQSHLTHQKTALSENQQQMIHEHPLKSIEWLTEAGVTDKLWLTIVLQHHESEAGDGYPKGINNPIRLSQLLRMCDIFCAKISSRATRRALPANQAMRTIFVDSKGLNSDLVNSLIKEMGVYPPGTYVKLQNGELAIVVKRGKTADSPIVMSLVNGQGMPNLQPMRRETDKAEFVIANTVPRDKIITRISLPKLWGY